MPVAAGSLPAVEARLRAMLVPYEARLEWATIYGNAALRRRGANAHNWFAFVKPASKHVSLFLLPVHQHPELLSACSPALLAHKTGEATFTFKELPDDMASDVEALLACAFEVYTAE